MAKHNFTVIRKSGRTSWHGDTEYRTVLDLVYADFRTAGRNWDAPNMLLMDGKVVVESGFADMAWKYGERRRELFLGLEEAIEAEFTPDWLDPQDARRTGQGGGDDVG